MEIATTDNKSTPTVKPPSAKKKKEIFANDKDRDVITKTPGAKAVAQKCGNPHCYVRASEATLKICARCKSTRYCSRECQAAHWKTHKEWCNINIDHAKELANADAKGFKFGLPPGITLLELDQMLERWVKFHNSLLMAATIHALALPRDIKRSRSYMLRVPRVAAKYFRVDDASVIDMDSGRALGGVWPESIDHINRMREESESLRRGTIAAVALECEPLAMQVVPFGSLRDLSPLRIQQSWKEILIKDVENGKRFTRFEMKS
ncbi:hypothetical protein BDZ97DRAFT_1767613 [Flammula alnicola]|nr:hypothetical protein BDZ97DRAFT_1767613 [Flammula alnicola]